MNDILTIRCQPILGAEPLMCCCNVQKRVHALGGKAVFGYEVKDFGFYRTLLEHAIWESPDGELMCVTPKYTAVGVAGALVEWPDSIRFIRDDSVYFDEATKGTGRYEAIDEHPRIVKACRYMTIADEHLHGGRINQCRYWTNKANAEMTKVPYMAGSGWTTPDSVEMHDVLKTMF
jgi:hypothetical protein